jgi:transcription elongation factor Elf1
VIVSKSGALRTQFDCAACHHVRDVEIRVDGAGLSVVGNRDDDAERVASSHADDEIAANAATMLGLVACPKCGRRAPRAVASLLVWSSMPALVLGAFAAYLWWMGGIAILLSLPMGLAAVAVPVLGVRSLERASRNVRFLE